MGKASRRKRERRLGLTLDLPAGMRSMIEKGLVTAQKNPDDRKISASLYTLVEPYLDGDESLQQVQVLVGLCVLAWNIASTEGTKREGLLRETMEEFRGKGIEALEGLIGKLTQRKIDLFPDDRRLVVSWEVREDRDRFYISAASAEADDEESEANRGTGAEGQEP